MARYFTAPRATKALWVEDDVFVSPLVPSLTVDDHEATDTGLLDQHGHSIMRAPYPMGFGRDDEW
jgi:hypothetical protein